MASNSMVILMVWYAMACYTLEYDDKQEKKHREENRKIALKYLLGPGLVVRLQLF